MARPKGRGRRARRTPRREKIQFAAVVLTTVTAIAGCVEQFVR
ncbi:hypothetical protein [Streptomyces bambusae]|nr:hypothetical protein [Streptomyces bambusae]